MRCSWPMDLTSRPVKKPSTPTETRARPPHTSLRRSSPGPHVVGQTGLQDVRTTVTSYDDTVGEPMTVTVDPNGLDLVKTYLYDETTGHVTAVRQPANSTGGDAHETDTTYYAATGSTPCGGQPAYAGLVCQVGPAAQPGTSGLPNIPAKTYQSYNLYDQPLVTTDTSGSATRTTTDGYDAMGRLTSESVTGNYGAASVPTISYGYDPNTGLQTTQSAAGGGTVTTAYDAIGRVTSYTDADANTSTYGYDIDGRVKSY